VASATAVSGRVARGVNQVTDVVRDVRDRSHRKDRLFRDQPPLPLLSEATGFPVSASRCTVRYRAKNSETETLDQALMSPTRPELIASATARNRQQASQASRECYIKSC
jgi:hypothetical protein